MAFRFALMMPATCRIFHAFVRYKCFVIKTLKGNSSADGWLLMAVYKMTPVLLGIQIFFIAAAFILNGYIDKDALPGMLNICVIAFICLSSLYMVTVLIIDLRQSDWCLLKQLLTPRYVVRLVCATAFFTCVLPTYHNFLIYVQERQCNIQATTSLAALIEYLTIIGISGFHFSELFDLDLVYYNVIEGVSR
uniref:Aa_trans domain-containing protein n=1 Tax=Panagrellus redivivus TaxID=6233 RepID=A0A7E4VGU3_PANRE